jgi:hypothetical protein
MDNSIAVINIIVGILLILLNIGAYFLFENIKENINKIQIDLNGFSVPSAEKDRVLYHNYFKTKIKFYKRFIGLLATLYGAGGILMGIFLVINGFFLQNNNGIISNLSYIIPITIEFFVFIIIPYFYFVKIKPCQS